MEEYIVNLCLINKLAEILYRTRVHTAQKAFKHQFLGDGFQHDTLMITSVEPDSVKAFCKRTPRRNT